MKAIRAFTGVAAMAVLQAVTAVAQQGTPSPDRASDGASRRPMKVLRDLAYVPGGRARQKLDLYLPAKATGPLPLIIWIHGGAWLAGSKKRCPAVPFVARGYAVASINYRFSSDAIFPAQIEDCKAAVRWLRAHAREYQLDPERFGAWGASAGGHLAALLGTSGGVKAFDRGPNTNVSSRVQAVVDFYGPTDLLRMASQSGPNSRMNHDAPDSPESRLIGGPLQKNRKKAALANPIAYVTADDPPMLLVHGDSDPLVPYQQSEELYAALKKAGVKATLHLVKGGGHGTGFGPEVNVLVNRFFDEQFKTLRVPNIKRKSGARVTRPSEFRHCLS